MKLKSSLLNRLIEISTLIDNTTDEEYNIERAKNILLSNNYCALMYGC